MRTAHGVDEDTLDLYRLTLRYDTLDSEIVAREAGLSPERAADALARLEAVRLVRPAGAEGRFRPMPPEWAEAELLTPVLSDLHATQRFIEETRKTLQDLGAVYSRARDAGDRDDELTVLPPGEPTRVAVYRAVGECSSEFATTHLSATDFGAVLPDELEMRRRGIGVRTVVQHSVLAKLAVRSYVGKLTAAGGAVRSVPQLWFRLSLFDRRVLLVSACPGDEPASGAVLVRTPAIVARVHELFDHVWQTATPEVSAPGGRGEVASSELRAAIGAQLAAGCTDEVSARRLGMSVRTYRRHVANLMTELGARTRFQAGLLARDAGLVG
ncbi:hypothetical protein [Amycolatopsis sp. NPDC021455]|uniref:hypothetical protein n=1 Tax=Amycolatopsis sp. NPDC021455 TaxID=3154901 RepID=UPI0033E895D7